jgi:hypothetical protein
VGPFNMGNPGEFTMLELAEVCLPSKLPIVCNKVLFGSQKNAFRCGFFFFFFFYEVFFYSFPSGICYVNT